MHSHNSFVTLNSICNYRRTFFIMLAYPDKLVLILL
nr:MAG TPA: hypothetical protein [Caudoviricetes sp.]